MKKTKSQHVLDRWETRYDISDGELKFNPGTNLYDKDLPLAADVGKALGAEIPVVEALAKLGVKLKRRKSEYLKKGRRIRDRKLIIGRLILPLLSFILSSTVRTKTYRGHRVEFDSEEIRTREWIARATIVIADGQEGKANSHFRHGVEAPSRPRDKPMPTRSNWQNCGSTAERWGTNGHG